MKSTKLSTIMLSIIIALAMMLSIQNNAFSENWRDGFARISMLPQGVSGPQLFIANGFIYCAGGVVDGSNIDKIWYAKINSDGYLEEWNETMSLPHAVRGHQCLTVNGFVYCMGGQTISGGYSSPQIWFANIKVDGSLDNWQKTTSMPNSVYAHQSFTSNGYIYCAGGKKSYNTYDSISTISYAKLNNDGNVENWQETTSLPYSTFDHKCFTANGFVYCVGGYYQKNKISYASINSDGSLGNWKTTSLENDIYSNSCFIKNGFVYCLTYGYWDGLMYTDINSDGSLGTWFKKKDLVMKFSYSSPVYNEGNLYVLDHNVLLCLRSFISIPTHPDNDNWYITDKFKFNIADHVRIPYGFYYTINDSCEYLTTNDMYTTEKSFDFTSGKSIEEGFHYLNIAFADANYMPRNTHCFGFRTFGGDISANSTTHKYQDSWYGNNTFHIELNNINSNLTYRYTLDDKSNTIPNQLSPMVDFEELVLVNQPPGTHYFHIQVYDALGTSGNPLHFRYNIYDSDAPKPAPLPVVTKLNVNPTNVTKDGTIAIEGSIRIE